MDTGKNQMLADLANARRLSAEGRVREARTLLSRHGLGYIAVEIVPGKTGKGEVT